MSGNIISPDLRDDFTFDVLDGDEPIFDRRSVITAQPREGIRYDPGLPISTIARSFRSRRSEHVQILEDIEEVTIEQTYELHDILTILQSENRYFVKSNGDILFGGIEESDPFQRLFCSPRRKVRFTLYDRSREEAIYFTKRFAFSNCFFGCLLQKVKIYVKDSEFIGSVVQQWTPRKTTLFVNDSGGNLSFMIVGPTECVCPIYLESTFEVLDKNCDPVAKIGQIWDSNVMNFKLTVQFPRRANTVQKTLLLVSGIVLDYMFFESGRSGGCKCITCHR